MEILDGDRGKNYPKASEFTSTGYCLFLSAKNVTKTGFILSEKLFISKERDELLRKGKLNKYDLVLTTRGTVGNIAYFGDNISLENIRINSGMLIIRPDKDAIDDKFLYLVFRSKNFANQIANNQTGSAQPQLPIRDLKRLEITLPPLKEQRAIASILSELDNILNEVIEQAEGQYSDWPLVG
ncbi:MAG: restriction endonuclease subunit S [Flavobacteriales bacterium]|nr:restriction endonuclease subunit S [Flavobacteriales bacterium]